MEAVTDCLAAGRVALSVVSHGVAATGELLAAQALIRVGRDGHRARRYVRAPTGSPRRGGGSRTSLPGIWCDSGRMRRGSLWFSTWVPRRTRCSAGVRNGGPPSCWLRFRGSRWSGVRVHAVPRRLMRCPEGADFTFRPAEQVPARVKPRGDLRPGEVTARRSCSMVTKRARLAAGAEGHCSGCERGCRRVVQGRLVRCGCGRCRREPVGYVQAATNSVPGGNLVAEIGDRSPRVWGG